MAKDFFGNVSLRALIELLNTSLSSKQDKLHGTSGQVIGFNSSGNPVAQSIDQLKGETGPAGASAGFGTPTASIDANTGTPSVTVSASGPNTAKIFNFEFKNLKGQKGDKGDQGKTGSTGPKGSTGTRGSRWTVGTAITGTDTTGTIFSSSEITDSLVGDMYLNSSTWGVYKCTTAGTASVAKWSYVGSIKGATGKTGATGPAGTNATTTAVATTSANGLMSSAMVTKLNGIATGATANTAASAAPKANGTAAVGTSAKYAREDHVHPLETAEISDATIESIFNEVFA